MKKPGEINKTQPRESTGKNQRAHEAKQLAAYYEWQKRGAPIGDDFTDWDDIEQQWEEESPLDLETD